MVRNHDASFLRFDTIPECDGRTDGQTDGQTDLPLAIPAVCIARYANALVKTVRKFAEVRIYCQRQKCSPARDCTGDIESYGVIHWSNRTGSVKPVNCIYSFTLTVLTHAVH